MRGNGERDNDTGSALLHAVLSATLRTGQALAPGQFFCGRSSGPIVPKLALLGKPFRL